MDKVCPNCGHCPTCGRQVASPYYPWTVPYVQPWTTPWWQQGGTVTISAKPFPDVYIGDPPGSLGGGTSVSIPLGNTPTVTY